MKIAVTATEPTLDAMVDPRFGRCPVFLVIETDDLSYECVDNTNQDAAQGAGIQSASLLADQQVKHVLTGNCGPNAHQALSAAGVEVITGCAGAVRDVVEQFKAGQLTATDKPTVPGHSGMNTPSESAPSVGMEPGRGAGGGGGMGPGRGQGGGRGMGRGRGGGQGAGRGRGRGGR